MQTESVIRLEAVRCAFSTEELMDLWPHKDELLLGTKGISPVDLGFDPEGFTEEDMRQPLYAIRGASAKHDYLQAQIHTHWKQLTPGLSFDVPAYLSKQITQPGPRMRWSIRSFSLHRVYEYEREHWWQKKRLVKKDYFRFQPYTLEIPLQGDPDKDICAVLDYFDWVRDRTVSHQQLIAILRAR